MANIKGFDPNDNPNTPLARAMWLIDKLGGDPETGRCFCPAHDDEPSPSFDVALDRFTRKGNPLFKCRAGCEQAAVIAALKGRGLWPIPGTLPPLSARGEVKQHRSPEERRQYALTIYKAVKQHNWDRALAKNYFRKRGIKKVPANALVSMPLPREPAEHADGHWLSADPGIVFRVRDRDNKFRGIFVIWLNAEMTDKRKAQPQRQLYGPIKGAYVQIGTPEPDQPLVVAEGIETALAVLQITGLPCAIVGCGENTANIELPPHPRVIITADNGIAGQKIATELAARHAGPDCAIQIATPDKPQGGKDGYDWDDALIDGTDPVVLRDAIMQAPTFEEDDEEDDEGQHQAKQADTLIALASDAELFHNDGNGFADIKIDGHRETWPVRSKGFRDWLLLLYFKHVRTAPTSEAMRTAIATIDARARFESPILDVFMRVGGHAGKIYLDLCDEQWRVIEIDTNGWRLVSDAPVRFRRAPGMLPLPVPVKGGKVEALRAFVNVKNTTAFVLLVSFIVAALRDRGPYAGAALMGDEGSAKSTLVRVIRNLIDPAKVRERRLPREDRDLFILASNAHVVSFGNVSHIPDWLSDSLSSLMTGGGFGTRQLYTDQDEMLFDAMRPVILNGIEFATKSDLADRLIFLRLPPIIDEKRLPEKEFWAAFEAQRPAILGALLDVVAHGLRELPNTSIKTYPRMADFAQWATACEGALWEAGTFETAYAGNRRSATLDVIEAEPVANAALQLMQEEDEWSGTATQLLNRLEFIVGEKEAKRKEWPGSASALGGRLRRIGRRLRRLGIKISYVREGNAGARTITIRHTAPTKRGENGVSTVGAVRAKEFQGDSADSRASGAVRSAVRRKSLENKETDSTDSADSKMRTFEYRPKVKARARRARLAYDQTRKRTE